MNEEKRLELMKKLESYPTAFISACLEKGHRRIDCYSPYLDKWYTDCTLKCRNNDVGPRAGYAVTVRVGLPVNEFEPKTRFDLLRLIDQMPKPVTLVIQVDKPEELRNADSNFGGQFGHLCSILGTANVVCNSAVRDLEELKSYGMQIMIPGTIASTAPSVIYELNGKVEVAGMEVVPGDIVHMDSDGAIRFPADMLEQVIAAAIEESDAEEDTNKIIGTCKNLEDCLKAYEICHARCEPSKPA